MKILFVCKANRFRSKVSEAFLNKYKKNSKTEIKSAGIRIDPIKPYVCKNVINILKEKDASIQNENSKQIDEFDIKWADKIIITANNVSPDIFPKEKTIHWNIEDADESELEKIKIIVNKIEIKVKNLIKKQNL